MQALFCSFGEFAVLTSNCTGLILKHFADRWLNEGCAPANWRAGI
jgi:hypothetical protein